ncbi:MAG: hypothetical protein HC905_19560 [Bacteroidales bacterium]|nr:hypothetical protein [Bacteroidales bacterium]
MTPLIIKKSILINAPLSKVWKVLTKPEFTRQYMFGCDVVSDWMQGSSIEWKGLQDRNETVYIKGWIISVDPEKHVSYSTFDPQGGLPDIPENYLNVTYDLASKKDKTQLTITQGDFSAVTEGPERYSESLKGWELTLADIKVVAESEETEC